MAAHARAGDTSAAGARLDHALFHGGVPSDQRPALVDRFHADPACRVFLSTDAGGVGLNLQHAAATVVNMDLPWNPAVLEQRIGRVHRLGQSRSVQVVNFVAQGTIEHGMLSVLACKKSLFAGVLDGGETEVFMNGTRLSKFMESVEEVTKAMGEAETAEADAGPAAQLEGGETAQAEAPAQEAELAEEGSGRTAAEASLDEREIEAEGAEGTAVRDAAAAPAASSAEAATPAADPWAPLLEAGIGFVESLARRSRAVPEEGAQALPCTATLADAAERLLRVERDPDTGRGYLKLPVPEPQTVQRLAESLGSLLVGLRR